MTYAEKLLDPRWQKKRLEILERDNWTCQLCLDKETTLHIHHEKYSGNPWDAQNENLITYCKHCHGLIEWNKGVETIFPIKVFKIHLEKRVQLNFLYMSGEGPMRYLDVYYYEEDNSLKYRCSIPEYDLYDIKNVLFYNKAEAPH